MTSAGSPLARYRRALAIGSADQVIAAAHELPAMPLADTLELVLVLAAAGDRRFDAAVVRWHGRLVIEARGFCLDESITVLAALRGLGGPAAATSAIALAAVLETRGLDKEARVIDEWAESRES